MKHSKPSVFAELMLLELQQYNCRVSALMKNHRNAVQ